LFKAQQHRVVLGGKEVTPGQIFITNAWRLPFSDNMSIELKKNVFSSEIILESRFQGLHMKALGKKEVQEAEKLINERRSNSGFSRPDNKRDR
jgi:hypothetical protein